jgi:hypothetical protein
MRQKYSGISRLPVWSGTGFKRGFDGGSKGGSKGMREARAFARDMSRESTRAKHICARHGKMNKRCLFTVFALKNISSDSTLNPKFYVYISYQAGKQASKLGLI